MPILFLFRPQILSFPFRSSPFLFPRDHVTSVRPGQCKSSHQERVPCLPFADQLTPTLSHHALTNRFTPRSHDLPYVVDIPTRDWCISS